MTHIGCDHLTVVVPCKTMWISETVGIDLSDGIFFLCKGIRLWNSVLSIRAVFACRVYTKNCSPGLRFIMSQELVTVFNGSSVTDADVQQAIVLVVLFCQRIESYFLHAMNTAYHIYSHQLTTCSGKCFSLWIINFPFSQHPLQGYFDRICISEISFAGSRSFRMRRIQQSVFKKIGMKSKTSKTCREA